MTPDEKQAFKKAIPKAKETVKEAIRDIDVADPKVLLQHSLRAIELLLEIANKSLDDSHDS